MTTVYEPPPAPIRHANDGVTFLHLNQLRESTTNPRRSFGKEAHGELVDSLKAHGVLQPLLVRKVPEIEDKGVRIGAHFEIVAGARRFRAAKAAGLLEVPCFVRELTDKQVLEIQFVENLQRADLHPLDEGLGYKVLHEQHGGPTRRGAAASRSRRGCEGAAEGRPQDAGGGRRLHAQRAGQAQGEGSPHPHQDARASAARPGRARRGRRRCDSVAPRAAVRPRSHRGACEGRQAPRPEPRRRTSRRAADRWPHREAAAGPRTRGDGDAVGVEFLRWLGLPDARHREGARHRPEEGRADDDAARAEGEGHGHRRRRRPRRSRWRSGRPACRRPCRSNSPPRRASAPKCRSCGGGIEVNEWAEPNLCRPCAGTGKTTTKGKSPKAAK